MASIAQRFPACASHTPEGHCPSVQAPSEGTSNAPADVSVVAEPVERIEEIPVADSPGNRSTKGYCQNCNCHLGDFYNSWCRVTGSYYVPALRGSYTSRLKKSGKQKAAFRGTDLEGCTIQPVSCPALCTDSPIGFLVVDAPSGKQHYRNRDFFKLSRIELRYEPSPSESITVEPLEDISKDLLRAEHSFSPSPTPESPDSLPSMGGVAMDSLPPRQGHHHTHQEPHRDLTYEQTAMQQGDNNRQLPSSTAVRSPQLQMTRPNSTSKVQNQQAEQAPKLPQAPSPELRTHQNGSFHAPPVRAPAGAARGPSPDLPQRHSSHELRKTQHQQYPRSPPEVSLDAIQRLQTQISQNSGALAAHTRDIRRGEESFGYLEETLRREFSSQIAFQNAELQRFDGVAAKLSHEMQTIRQALEILTHELYANRGDGHSQQHRDAPPAQQVSAQESALELMAQQIAVTSHKANEVDMLKITVEIMKNKIQRLEEGGRQPPAPGPVIQSPNTYKPTSTHQSPQVQQHHSFTTHGTTTTPDTTQHQEHVPSQSSGWTTINSAVKRSHGNEADSLYNGNAQVPSSAKRPRLATESAPALVSSMPQTHTAAQDSQSHYIPHAQPLPSQPPLTDSINNTRSQQSSHAPFSTQEGPSDDGWRLESQRDIEHRPRGRGRGGGPGSRGGRARKSMPAQFHTPDWERDDWRGVPESQTIPDGFYNHAVRATPGIARRGTGGGGGGIRRGFTPTDRAMSMSATSAIGFESSGDAYEHGKRTRTKPVRNADGVLIRKDGRPDMRSQSSAANLRKVHARREGESEFSPSSTPNHVHDHPSANATETPSPSGRGALDHAKSKHDAIMGKMFPRGLDESRKQNDYTRELFDQGHDHSIHTRAPAARTTAQSPQQIKKEHVEPQSTVDTQGAREEVRAGTNRRESGPGDDVEIVEGQRPDTTNGSPGSRSEN